jgi:diaminopimelate epimerase
VNFTKMQGTGNDYIYIDCFNQPFPPNPGELSKKLSDRHFGVGSDGIIFISPSKVANLRMDIYNADGSRAEICGNGLRCVGKYAYERGIVKNTQMLVETLAGTRKVTLDVEGGRVKAVRVNMGAPVLKPSLVPVKAERDSVINMPVEVDGKLYYITAVSMGNPHCVIFVDSVDSIELDKIGPALEKHKLFPKRTNVEFAEITDEGIKVRVWERGAGETLACGTGAAAVLAAAVINGKSERRARLFLRGGELLAEWDADTGEVFLTGGAEFVFDGKIC